MLTRRSKVTQAMRTAATSPAEEADLSDVELRAWRGLVRAHDALVKRLDAELEAAHGLSLSSYQVLSALADSHQGKMRMCELAESVALSRSGLTRLVDRLERERLIARACCHVDARGAYAVLTPMGRERLEEARPTHQAAVRQDFV